MKISKQLVEWLKWHSDNGERDITLNMMKSGELADVASTKVMLDECLRVGLIQVTGIELYNGTMPRYIHYKLSAIGEIALCIPAASEPATSTPVSDSGAGDKWNNEYYLDKDGDYFRLYKTSQVAPIADFSYGEKAVAEITTRLLNKEIASLRSQLAEITRDAQRYLAQVAERERQLAAATRELESMKAEIGHLGKTIDEAGYYLGQASDRDENSNRAYSILKGYSVAD
jgi:hypothetical protein